MDINEIKTLIEAMAASDLSAMEVERDGWTLRLARAPAGAATPAARRAPRAADPVSRPVAAARDDADGDVRSPLSGAVHFRPAPDAPPFVEPGRRIKAGDVLCLVEAMKMFNEVRAERAGVVDALLARPGEDVEAGQPLLRIA